MSSMDYYGDVDQLPPSFGNASLILQQHRLRDREADLKERIKAAREKAAPQGQMVSGYYVPPSKAQILTPLVEQLTQALEKKGLDADQTGYDKYEMQAVARHMASKPPDDAPQPTKLAWAQQGAQIPALRSLMMDYAKDQLVNEPERVAVRTDRKEARAETIAEARRRQQEDLEYKRERDAANEQLRRDLAGDSNDLRRTLAAAVRANGGGGGGGGGGSVWAGKDVISKENSDGTVTLIHKPTGETKSIGAVGRESATITKERQEQGEKVSNAKKALTDLDEAERLLPVATGSAAGSLRDTIAGAAGISTDGAKAAARLDQIASTLAGQVPRLGGATSDKDLEFYKEQVGNLGDRSKPVGVRLAALKQVRKFMERASDASMYADPTGKPASTGSSIRDAVKAASQPKNIDDLLNKYK
ncbi:cell wall-associated NlpC family hydrolase [Variovorax paradoxus]|uniref:hypothetical protein n=1 Tax=Variovorax paradoxus TaxID=34073 RepID=UPI0027819D37|nr:hypothetical protein [Variovorax paradoxus]MDP9963559.1 cell wall-associated NlpC family hydrolase [Variovorax paradoxus]